MSDRRSRVLVAVASEHGSTLEIADALADRLGRRGLHAAVARVETVTSLDGWDAVVLGSAVYTLRCLPIAHAFASEHSTELRRRHVWLFTSGPVGERKHRYPSRPAEDIDELMSLTGAREHRELAGRLDRRLLTPWQRFIVRLSGATPGDSRDWAKVSAYADEIADAMSVTLA